MKEELEDIENFLRFHKDSLEQVRLFQAEFILHWLSNKFSQFVSVPKLAI